MPTTDLALTLAVEAFIHEPIFRLLKQQVTCPHCAVLCQCIGYHDHTLHYRCPRCTQLHADYLGFEPLFAADWLQIALMQHYQIGCPYCHKPAYLVGGTPATGLFFVCQERCHHHFARTIRRF
jgi:hypothetical protein